MTTPTDPTIEADVLELLARLVTAVEYTGGLRGPKGNGLLAECHQALADTKALTIKPSQQSQPPAADEVEALRIAAFLRERATSRHSPTARAALNNAADAIERGDWRE